MNWSIRASSRTNSFSFSNGSSSARSCPLVRAQRGQISDQVGADRSADELPEDSAHFWFDVEAEPVVDTPDTAFVVDETMRQLAIGVVGNVVEEHHPLDLEQILRPELTRVPGLIGLAWRLVKLEAARTHRSIHNDGRGDERPAEEPGQPICGNFPQIQRAVGEVVQRVFAVARFIDCQLLASGGIADCDGERVVRAPGNQFRPDYLSTSKQLEDIGFRKLGWPGIRFGITVD